MHVDLKLFTKVLGNRLSPLFLGLIHRDHMGFILGHEARENTRKTIHLTVYLTLNNIRFWPAFSRSTQRKLLIESTGISYVFLQSKFVWALTCSPVLCHYIFPLLLPFWSMRLHQILSQSPMAPARVVATFICCSYRALGPSDPV